MYIDELDLNKYNNVYHKTIKMKPVDINQSMYIDFNEENDNDGPKFKVGDQGKISQYKNIFEKVYVPHWSEELFMIKKVKNTVPRTYAHML